MRRTVRPPRRRRAQSALLVCLVALALAVAWRVAHDDGADTDPPEPGSAAAVVTAVVDGDTIKATIGSDRVTVRLLGLDAPETPDGCGARAATDRLRELLPAGTRVALVQDPVSDPVDRYGRLLRYVETGGVDVGARLVAEGLAGVWWPKSEPAPTRGAAYEATEAIAATTGTGSWSSCDQLGR
ncbi:MAG: thermonuclease family protein [Propionibacteriaceae bacterium]|jgi:endonuclease YncB( thermonuclease family)|nr:thermonuclease family protein [Propionibacteriaceae bacterium]